MAFGQSRSVPSRRLQNDRTVRESDVPVLARLGAIAKQRWPKGMEGGMTIRATLGVAMGLALLTSAGCQQAPSIRDDLSRALASPPQSRNVAAARPAARTRATSAESARPSPPDPAAATVVESANSGTPQPSPAAAGEAAHPPSPV